MSENKNSSNKGNRFLSLNDSDSDGNGVKLQENFFSNY